MPYTLSMALLWVSLAVLLGIVIGWLMRSVVAKRQIERARSNHLDNVELERLRARVAELEPAAAERDALRAELATTPAAPTPEHRDVSGDVEPDVDRDVDPDVGRDAGGDVDRSSGSSGSDLDEAAAILGRPVTLDDLTVVEGIGPKVADLCAGIGITTWRDLAATEVSLLRTMLHDAGSRFRTHDPSTWPEQARLLAAGRWAEFRLLTDGLTGGAPVGSPDLHPADGADRGDPVDRGGRLVE